MSNDIAITKQLEKRENSTELMMSPERMDSMMRMAELMASGRSTIPLHLQKSPADCMAVVMQATQWGMNPFAVAQKTHVSQGGVLGYEAQLISAVISANAPVKEEAPEYEFIGDWSKVLGKVEERKSDKGGKYFVAAYTKADEVGLGVICRMTLSREHQPREITVMMSQCYPRFSTQWANDPKQQICYVAVRKWSRLFAPGVILGVYSPDELQDDAPRNMGEAEVLQPKKGENILLKEAEGAASKGVAAYNEFWSSTGKENRKALATDHERLKVVADTADKSRTIDASQKPAAKTFDDVMAMMCAAKTLDALYVAGECISSIGDDEGGKILESKFDEIKTLLEGGAP